MRDFFPCMQEAELGDLLNALGELDSLAAEAEADTASTRRVMQLVEEEQELRHRLHMQAMLLEARRLGGQVQEELQP